MKNPVTYSQYLKMHSPCVYGIRNTKTKFIYIGSTINLFMRLKEHFTLLRDNRHGIQRMQKDYDKYGEDSFTIEIIDRHPEVKCKAERTELFQKEFAIMASNKNLYNKVIKRKFQ